MSTLKASEVVHGRLSLEVRIYENGTVAATCRLSKATVSGTDHTSFDWKGDHKITLDLNRQAVPRFKELLERVFSSCVKKVQEKLAKDPAKFERLRFAGLVKDWKA